VLSPILSISGNGDRDVLFAVLAINLDFLEPERFTETWKEWKSQALMPWPDFLVARKVLSADERQVLARLMERKLRRHAGQVEPCLEDLVGERARNALATVASRGRAKGNSPNGSTGNSDEQNGPANARSNSPRERGEGKRHQFWPGARRWSRVLIGCAAAILVGVAIVTFLQLPEGAGGSGRNANDDEGVFALRQTLPAVGMPASREQIDANDRERAERYPKVLAQAEKQWQRGRFHEAATLLELEQPPRLESYDHRNFEWHYLHRLCSAARFDFPAGQGILVAMAYSGDGAQLLTVAESGQVKVWDAGTGHLIRQWSCGAGPLSAAAFSKDSQKLVTATRSNALQFWDVPSAALLSSIQTKIDGVFRELAISPDARRCAVTIGNNPSIWLWDMHSKTEVASFRGHENEITSVVFSPGGLLIASAGLDCSARLWQADETGSQIRSFHFSETPDAAQCKVRFSPDGSRLAACSGKVIQIWDVASGDRVAGLKGEKAGPFHEFCFSPDGTRVVSAATDGILRIWDATSGKELLALMAGSSNHFAFSPDGASLAAQVLLNTLTVENSLVIWETRPPSSEEQGRREAVRIVDELYRKTVDREEIKQHIRNNPWLGAKVRETALSLAETIDLDPTVLNNTSWSFVRAPGHTQEVYERALHQAEEAVRKFPSSGYFVTTLGIAQYRLERYPKALETLLRSSKLNASLPFTGRISGIMRMNQAANGSDLPADVAFLAMTHCRLGQTEEALQGLSRLRLIMERQTRLFEGRRAEGEFNEDRYQEALNFLKEAEALIDKSNQ
jgi:hypothetical protein